MNEKHKLDAPHNDALQTVEQLGDHVELSVLYPEAKPGWDGTIMSEADREKRRTKQLETFATSIRGKAILVGILIPAPIIITAFTASVLYEFILPATQAHPEYATFPYILGAFLAGASSFIAIKYTAKLFYMHTLRLAPYMAIAWALLGMSAQTLYLITAPLHGSHPTLAAVIVSAVGIVWSIGLNYVLLRIWTAPYIESSRKFSYIALIAVGLVAVTSVLNVLNVLHLLAR